MLLFTGKTKIGIIGSKWQSIPLPQIVFQRCTLCIKAYTFLRVGCYQQQKQIHRAHQLQTFPWRIRLLFSKHILRLMSIFHTKNFTCNTLTITGNKNIGFVRIASSSVNGWVKWRCSDSNSSTYSQFVHTKCSQTKRIDRKRCMGPRDSLVMHLNIGNVRHLPCHLGGLNTTHILTFTKNSIQRYFGTSFHRRCLLI